MSRERVHEQASDPSAARLGRHDAEEELGAATSAAAGTPMQLSRFSATTVARLQRSAGSRAVSSALAVQRHAEGTELPTLGEDATEVAEKQAQTPAKTGGVAGAESAPAAGAPPAPTPEEPKAEQEQPGVPSPPAATRTADEEKKQVEAGKQAGADYSKAQKLSPGAMSLAGAQAILQGVYGGMKTIVTGKIEILADQPAVSAKYDDLCIADGIKRPDGSAWKKGDCAKDDAAAGVLTQGFAWKGVVYVNGKTTLVTATAHEILHNNTTGKFRAAVGETFNEGATEYFARKALKSSGVAVPDVTAYPTQVKMTTDLVALVGEDTLMKAYFEDPDVLVKAFEAKGSKTFAELRAAAEALDATKVADAQKPKAAAAAPAKTVEAFAGAAAGAEAGA